MSVINQMLKDLDKRQQGHQLRNIAPHQLQYAGQARASKSWILVSLISLALGALAVYVLQNWPHSSQAEAEHVLLPATPVAAPSAAPALASTPSASIPSVSVKDESVMAKDESGKVKSETAMTTPPQMASPHDRQSPTTEPQRGEYSAAPTTAAVDARAIATKNAVASSPALMTSSGVSSAAATPVATPEPSAAVVSANSAMVNTNTAMVSANTALESAASSAANVSGAVNIANTASAAYPQAERAMTVTEVSLTPPQLAQKQLALAKAAEGQGELRQAINHYQQALTLTPGLHAARKQQAALLYGQEQWSQASAVLAQGILLYPQQFEFALLLARVQQAKGDGVEALASLELIPDDHELARQKWLAQTDLAQKQGQFALAEQAYRKLLQQEPRQGKWWMGLAYALDSQQQYHHARQAYRTALTHTGLSSQATAFIEQRLTQLGDSQ